MPEIYNDQDVIDSRDVIARIEELTLLRAENIETMENGTADDEIEDFTADDADELASLEALADQSDNCEDWTFGATLIRDDYFEAYAMQLAEDIGAVDRDAPWPQYYIDWEAAANALLVDYTELTFGGVTYWVR